MLDIDGIKITCLEKGRLRGSLVGMIMTKTLTHRLDRLIMMIHRLDRLIHHDPQVRSHQSIGLHKMKKFMISILLRLGWGKNLNLTQERHIGG